MVGLWFILLHGVSGIEYLFLVGGFAESPIIQHALKSEYDQQFKIVIPQDVSLTILKGKSFRRMFV